MAILRAKDAIDRHMQWKVTLRSAILNKQPLSSDHMAQIRFHSRCSIGEWLDSPATLPLRNDPAFRELVDRHYAFHQEMGKIAALITAGHFDQAARALDDNSTFQAASSAIAKAIMAVDRIVPIAVPA